ERGGRRHVVVVPAVLVVGEDQRGLVPGRAVHHRVDDARRELLAQRDVLRGPFGGGAVVRLDQAEARQGPGGRVGEELRVEDDLRRGVLLVEQRVQRQRGRGRDEGRGVVLPGDPVRVELVEDRAGRRRVGGCRRGFVDLADRGRPQQVAPVGEGLAEDRAVVA